MRDLTIGVFFALSALLSIPVTARAETPDLSVAKQCYAEAEQKGLGQAARTRYAKECQDRHSESQTTVTVKGGKVSDAEKDKLVYCGGVAQARHLSGDSFNRFMRECLGR